MDAEVRARLVAVADRAVEDYDSGAEPYRSVGEAVIDALRIERAPDPVQPTTVLDYPSSIRWVYGAPVFRLGVLSLPPEPQAAPKC